MNFLCFGRFFSELCRFRSTMSSLVSSLWLVHTQRLDLLTGLSFRKGGRKTDSTMLAIETSLTMLEISWAPSSVASLMLTPPYDNRSSICCGSLKYKTDVFISKLIPDNDSKPVLRLFPETSRSSVDRTDVGVATVSER